jgi:hypothetical protein
MFQTAFQANAFQNNAFQIAITPTPTGRIGGDDAWTPEERKRRKQLEKKLQVAEQKRIEAVRLDQESRKQAIRDLIDPKPVADTQQSKVQSNQQVSEDTPSEVTKYDALIANLERQKQDLFDAVLIRQAKVQLEQELAVLEAKRKQELDDEEAILLLL